MRQSDELVDLMRELYNISGFRVTLHDTELREIASYPLEASVFCGWIQRNPKVRRLCEECDAQAFQWVKRTKKLHIYHCHCGLYEAVVPLYSFGVLTGYLMMGQMLDSYFDSRTQVIQLAKEYLDPGEYGRLQQLVAEIPTTTEEKIASYAHIMSICAEYITLTNRSSLGSRNLADEISHYISVHYAERITIGMLEKRFLTSKSTLMNTFKRSFNKTINRYLTEVRLENARSMLLNSNHPIYQIAEDCGFSDQNYFAKVFIREYGVPPSRYRVREEAKIGE